jgi:nitrite reductase/ring-hydroxylating ferredoxin subunit
MRRVFGLLARCCLRECNRQGTFILDDKRVICEFHARLYAIGSKVGEAYAEELNRDPHMEEFLKEEAQLEPGSDESETPRK